MALMAEGPLEEDFNKICETWTLRSEPLFKPLIRRVSESLIKRLHKDPESLLDNLIESFQPDVVKLST